MFLHRQAVLCWRGQGVRCTLATNMMHRPEDTLQKIRAHLPGDLQSCSISLYLMSNFCEWLLHVAFQIEAAAQELNKHAHE